MLFTIWGCSNVAHTPNNSFKPKPLRYTKGMAGKACHAFGSTTRFGLTQALCASGGDDETHMGRALGFGRGSVLERDLACSRMDLATLRQGLGVLDRHSPKHRSEARRVGKGGVRTVRAGRSADHEKK